MKKILFSFMFLATMLVASCKKEDVKQLMPEQYITAVSCATKTSLSGKSIVWTKNDQVKAYDEDGTSYISSSVLLNNDENATTGSYAKFGFSTTKSLSYAVYPAANAGSINENFWINYTLPSVQDPVPGSFANDANVSIAKVANDGTAFFYNVGAILGVTVGDENLSSISVEGQTTEGYCLAGSAQIKIEDGNVVRAYSSKETEGGVKTVTMNGSFTVGQTYFFVVYPENYTSFKLSYTKEVDGVVSTAVLTYKSTLELNSNDYVILYEGAVPESKWSASDGSTEKTDIEDNIQVSCFGSVSGNGYNTYSTSGLTAQYQGYFMKSGKNGDYLGGDIQMRAKSSTKDGSYLVSKTSAGYVSQIETSWINHPTNTNNPLTVYGSNSPFTENDYYNDIANGEVLGSVSADSPILTVNGSYQYLGLIATGGAYLSSVKVTWSSTSISTKTIGSISADYSGSLKVGEYDEYDVLYNGDGNLSIESSDENVAEAIIEGSSVIISANGEGSTTITISAPATDNYTSAKLEYELTVTGNQTVLYVLKTLKNSSNSAYATYYNVTIDGLMWTAPGNQTTDGFWRIGGKQLSNTVRSITGKNAVTGNVDRVIINTNGKSNNSLVVVGIRLVVSTDQSFNSIVSQMSGSITDLRKVQFDRPEDKAWNSCYYKIEFELTNSTSSNYGIDLTSVEFIDLL